MLWVAKPADRRDWMDLHKNARSCPASRAVLVERVMALGWTAGEDKPRPFREPRGSLSRGTGGDERRLLLGEAIRRIHGRESVSVLFPR
jgi:hypothetical protein